MLKYLLLFALMAATASAAAFTTCGAGYTCPAPDANMLCIVLNSANHNVLASLVTGLDEADCNVIVPALISADKTLFAPVNDAITSQLPLPDGTVVADVLKYHLVAAKVLSPDVPLDTPIDTVLGNSLRATLYEAPFADSGLLINCKSKVNAADLTTQNNAVVHSIEGTVLLPTPSIVTLLLDNDGMGDNEFGILLKLVLAADLADVLASAERITVFAPTNKAFRELFDPFLGAGWEYNDWPRVLKPLLIKTLKYHVTGATYCAGAFAPDSAYRLDSLLEKKWSRRPRQERFKVKVNAAGTVVRVKDGKRGRGRKTAKVVAADLVVSQGVVHGIDKVLLYKFWGIPHALRWWRRPRSSTTTKSLIKHNKAK